MSQVLWPVYVPADPEDGPGCGQRAHTVSCLCDVIIPPDLPSIVYRGPNAHASLAEETLIARGNLDPSSLDIAEQMLAIRDVGDRIMELRLRMEANGSPVDPVQQARDGRFLCLLRMGVSIANAGRRCGMERGEYVPISSGEGRYFQDEFKALLALRLRDTENRRARADFLISNGTSTRDVMLATGFSKAAVNNRRRSAAA